MPDMQTIGRGELQAALEQVERAIGNHLDWYDALARTLVCRLPVDMRRASPTAHRECAFGLWYYNDASALLRAHPAFAVIEAQHQAIHDAASLLLRQSQQGGVDAAAYDAFTDGVGRFRLELENLRAELQTMLGSLDPLTGAHNRIGMLTWLRTQQQLVERGVMSCGLAMVDLDHFKSINDTYGHPAGDAALSEVARFLTEHVRPYDRVYRYGGEEFLLCLPGTEPEASYALTDRLREGVARREIEIVAGQVAIRCHISCGVAQLDAALPVESSIERADQALYRAKSAGRNRTCVWDDSPALAR